MHMDVQVSREHRDVRSDLGNCFLRCSTSYIPVVVSLRQIKKGAIRPLLYFNLQSQPACQMRLVLPHH